MPLSCHYTALYSHRTLYPNKEGPVTATYPQTRFLYHPLFLAVAAASVLLSGEATADHTVRIAPVVISADVPNQSLVTEGDPRQARQPIPASDAGDFLSRTPGFSAQNSGGTNGDPVLRGLSGSRINILVDGGEIIGACPSRMDAPSSYIAPESFDHFEIIKGPQTVKHGPVGSAGTVLFERRTQPFLTSGSRGRITLQGGSYGRFGQLVDLTTGNEQGYIRAIGQHDRAEDYKDGSGNKVPSKWMNWNGDVLIGATPNSDTLIELGVGAGDGEARYAARNMDGAKFERRSTTLRFEQYYYDQALESIEARFYHHANHHVMDNYSLREPEHMAMAMPLKRTTTGGRVTTHWALSNLHLATGVDAQISKHQDQHHAQWQKDMDYQQVGYFAELEAPLVEQHTLFAGARMDHYQVQDYRHELSGGGHGHGGGHTTPNPTHGEKRRENLPSAFLRYEFMPADSTTLYAGLGHTQRMPDYWELFSPENGLHGGANAFISIKPEKTTQLDIGAYWHGNTVDAWIAAYVGRIDNFILFTHADASNIDAEIMGAEAGSAWQFHPNFSADATLAYARGRNADERSALPQIPPLDARLALQYEKEKLSAGMIWRLVDSQHRVAVGQGNVVGVDLGPNSAFNTLALNAAYRLHENFTVSAGVDNVLDKTYSEHLNKAGSAGFGYPADTRINEPGRQFWLKADYQF